MKTKLYQFVVEGESIGLYEIPENGPTDIELSQYAYDWWNKDFDIPFEIWVHEIWGVKNVKRIFAEEIVIA